MQARSASARISPPTSGPIPAGAFHRDCGKFCAEMTWRARKCLFFKRFFCFEPEYSKPNKPVDLNGLAWTTAKRNGFVLRLAFWAGIRYDFHSQATNAMNIPNSLTIARIFFVPLLVAVLVQERIALHFNGAEIDDVTVLVRAPRDMNLIQVSGALRPLDLIHLSGHFGIPKVDPNAVMVPAPDGK